MAGPVFAGAVILTANDPYPDSKQVSPEEREKLAQEIKKKHIYAVGTANVQEIEELNILQAVFLAMKRAVLGLPTQTGHVLVDGNFLIQGLPNRFKQTAFVKGDKYLSPISAGGIIAKVSRDRWIVAQEQKYPQYGFSAHKGYGTAQHKSAIARYGPCPLHRRSFAGVKEFIKR